MSLSFLNTALKPANTILVDACLNGNSFQLTSGVRSGWFKYGFGDVDASTYVSKNTINETFPDSSARPFKMWKGGTSGSNGISQFYIYQEDITYLDISKLTTLNSCNIQIATSLTELKLPVFKDTALQNGLIIDNIDVSTIDLRSARMKGVQSSIYVRNCPSLETLTLPTIDIPLVSYLDISGNPLLSGTLDASGIKFGDTLFVYLDNNNLDAILFPESSALLDRLYINDNNISGDLDLTKLTGIGNYLDVGSNPITSITFPETSRGFQNLYIDDIDASTIDLTKLTGSINYLTVATNNSLKNLILPDSSAPFSNFRISNTGLETLDVSNRIFTNCSFNAGNTYSLNKIIWPDASCSFSSFFFQNGSLPGTVDVSNHYFTGFFLWSQLDTSILILDEAKMDVTSFSLRNCYNLTGGYDLSTNSRCTQINVEYTDLGWITPPKDREALNYNIAGTFCASGGTVDLSSVASLSAFNIRSTDASVIQWPYDSSSNKLSYFYADGCKLNGVLDLRVFPYIDGDIEVYSNSGLTGIILPDASSPYIYGGTFQAYNCDLQGNLDLSLLKNRRYFTVYGNSDLMSIDLPTLVQNNNYHIAGRFHDCSLNQTTVDGILSAYATLFQNITIGYNFTLSLEGGTNAVPTDGSLNVDISILEYEFSQSTRTLTLTYNT